MKSWSAHLATSPKQILHGGIISALRSLLFTPNAGTATSRNRIGNCHGQSWPAGYPGPGLVYRLGMSSLNLAMGLS